MEPRQNHLTSTFGAPSPRPAAAVPADAPPMTRVAAVVDERAERRVLTLDEVKIKMKRRRIDKAGLHKDVALLERGLAIFIAEFELRMGAIKQRTFWDF